jgi:hypothetical protein
VPEGPWRAAGAAATGVGLAAALAPGRTTAAFGLPPPDGSATLAWRMFGIRTAAVGLGMAAGSVDARRLLLPVQALDQAAFLVAGLSGAVPRRSAVRLCATSGVLVVLGLLAQERSSPSRYSFSTGA